jgi:hypothetical protein
MLMASFLFWSLSLEAKQNVKLFNWAKVEAIQHHANISKRIKFVLQDLMLDFKDSSVCLRLLDGVVFCQE